MDEREYMPTNEIYDFVHFDSINQCEIFLVNNLHVSVAYKCCGGRGIASFRKNVLSLCKNEKTGQTTHKQDKTRETKGTCDICFIENSSLYSKCTKCIQPFCMNCLTKLPTKACPYCRSELRIF